MRILMGLLDAQWQNIAGAGKSQAAKIEHNWTTWTDDKVKKKLRDLEKEKKERKKKEGVGRKKEGKAGWQAERKEERRREGGREGETKEGRENHWGQ